MNLVKAVVIALLVVPALLLLAIGPRGNASLPTDRIIVDYWEKWTGEEGAQMQQIVNEFNKTVGAEKGIFVRYVSASSITQKTLISTAAGVPPDIAGLWNDNIAQFAALDALEPLEEMAAAHGITRATYKKVYWDACTYDGHLYALVSTPAAIALHYNKKAFADNASALREAGLDPTRPPQTLDELDAYGKALTKIDASGHLVRSGYLPMEPGWYINYTAAWFGASIWDDRAKRFTLTDPAVVRAYEWIQSYSKRLGKNAIGDFRSGLGNFDSPQNPFLIGSVLMQQQGPWMANYIDHLKPKMSTVLWPKAEEMTKPRAERVKNYEWGVAPFPSAVPGLTDVSYCPFDALMIPRGAKHKREAFEFIAYVNRQDIMEKLCKLHCKNSPLAKVSEDFLNNHLNPYIDVFERLAGSPNASGVPPIPIWPEVAEELSNLTQRLSLLEVEPKEGLAQAQARLQAKYDEFMRRQSARRGSGAVGSAN